VERTRDDQKNICKKYGAEFFPSLDDLMIGISRNFDVTNYPLNGLRHLPESGTCGWYIWSGEKFSEAPDFFEPMHVAHLTDVCSIIVKYFGLPPGWRFLVAPDHEDVWFDENLLGD
jgi:hypothetical protein